MKLKTVLRRLEQMAKEDEELNLEANLYNILDYLAVIGVPGASELYMEEIKHNAEKLKKNG
jgi:hypothetical protein